MWATEGGESVEFNLGKTVALIRGGLFDHERTWQSYLADDPSWQTTAVVLTGPLIIGSTLLTMLFSRLIGGWSIYSVPGANIFTAMVMALVMGALSLVVLTLTLGVLAGAFGGKRNFDRAFAAVSLALIPGHVLAVVGALLPWIGVLFGLAGFVISLVFLYRILPLALEVPGAKRMPHFVTSLVATFAVNLIAGGLLGTAFHGDQARHVGFGSRAEVRRDAPAIGGWVGEMERQSQMVAAAQADRFEPPPGGVVTDAQLMRLLDVVRKTRGARADYTKRMEAMAQSMQDKRSASLSDLGKIYSGVSEAVGAHNVEMELVKTSGANWAEHQWVKEQLRAAMLHQGSGSNAIEQNFRLYQVHQEELKEAL
jgi:hypothetical protein